uniref:Uncharacterized protein n=1 Tax=Ficus carica TaxID=3494 RepID=A0AA88EGY2_FICCA|nr:hypothetical protein TIFTF001_052455 [Ficus carica]GMN74792.1 hypothetical protein TIFTF001_052458 [Ficus carica]
MTTKMGIQIQVDIQEFHSGRNSENQVC